MRLDEIKRGFWGYKKDSVYQYVALMEEDFSAKLLKKDEQLKEAVERAGQESAQAAEQAKRDAEAAAAQAAEQAKKDAEAAAAQAAEQAERLRLQAEASEQEAESLRKKLEQAQLRLCELESSLHAVQEENQALRQESHEISAAILEAQRYAQRLRTETMELEQKARASLQAEVERQHLELREYAGRIGRLKQSLNALLMEVSTKIDSLEEDCAKVDAHTPAPKLVAFPPLSRGPFFTADNHQERPS